MLSYNTTLEVLDRTLVVTIRYAICSADPDTGYSGCIEEHEVTIRSIDGAPCSDYSPAVVTALHEEANNSVQRSIDNNDSLAEALWENANEEDPFEDYPWE